jgi:general secretion pathway protein K
MQIYYRSRQAGSALLTALFIMTLVAIAATAMTLRLKLDIARMQITVEASALKNKAHLPTLIGIQWLRQSRLPAAKRNNNPATLVEFTHLTNDKNWQVSGKVIDLQSRFNINNLENKNHHKPFQKLLMNQGIEANTAKKIIKLCHYWTQPHRLERGHDPLLSEFLAQKPPYYPGYQLFTSPSEIRLIPGVSSQIAEKLMPSIIALPNLTPINIATAPPELIKILGDGLKDNQVNRIIELRSSGQIHNKSKLDELLKQYNIPANQVTVQSNYFLVVAKVSYLDKDLQQFTIIERTQQKEKKKVKLNVVYVSYHAL